jgi:hypothetical protein
MNNQDLIQHHQDPTMAHSLLHLRVEPLMAAEEYCLQLILNLQAWQLKDLARHLW